VSIGTRLFAVTAALLITATVAAGGASAATPGCGNPCFDLSTSAFGSVGTPTFVLADVPQLDNVGQPLTLARASATNQGEDFVVSDEGLVTDFVQAGLMEPGMGVLYGSLSVFELEYAPFGAETGLCVGVPTAPANGTRVELEPCGVSSKTTWIPETGTPFRTTAAPLISGATSNNFFDPYVMTAPAPGLPLTTSMLRINNAALAPNQLWGAIQGAL
jgi:hypothetical protein